MIWNPRRRQPEKLDRLHEVLKQLVVFKVLDRVGPRAAEYGQYLKRHIEYVNGQGFEWVEDPKHLAAIIRNRSKVGAKPQSSPSSKDLGKSDPEALDELEQVEGKLYQQDTGISIYVSSGRFDIQFCVRWQDTQIRSSRVRRHCENCRRLRLGWKRGTLFHARRAGIPWRTSRGFVGCIRSSASIEFRRSRAPRNRGRLGTRNLHKAHVRGVGRTINIDVETDSTAAIGMCSRTGVGKTRHIQVRWLWIQDANRDKVVTRSCA